MLLVYTIILPNKSRPAFIFITNMKRGRVPLDLAAFQKCWMHFQKK